MFTVETLRKMLNLALTAIESHLDKLNELDAATGDGDHGTAILAAMRAAAKASNATGSLADLLNGIGWEVMGAASGSTSSLTGSFYVGMAQAVSQDALETDEVIAMFEGGLHNVRATTKAAIGDKTLMDALIPAMEAMTASRGTGKTLSQLLAAAAKAARTGAESTKDLVAKHGRAKNLGERTRGHYDAGAMSTALIYEAFAKACE